MLKLHEILFVPPIQSLRSFKESVRPCSPTHNAARRFAHQVGNKPDLPILVGCISVQAAGAQHPVLLCVGEQGLYGRLAGHPVWQCTQLAVSQLCAAIGVGLLSVRRDQGRELGRVCGHTGGHCTCGFRFARRSDCAKVSVHAQRRVATTGRFQRHGELFVTDCTSYGCAAAHAMACCR